VTLAADCRTTLNVTGTVSGELTYHAGSYLNSDQVLEIPAEITYRAGNTITLNSGFDSGGGLLTASIAACKGSSKRIGTPEDEEITYVYEIKKDQTFLAETAEALELKCFPNPFQSRTTLEYDLELEGHVLLVVTDVNNRVIATLVNESQDTGIQSVDFSGSDLPSGIYFAKLKTGNKVSTARLLITK